MLKFSLAHPNPGKRSTENFTKISRQISRHLWQRKTEKIFTSALLQGSCSEIKGPLQKDPILLFGASQRCYKSIAVMSTPFLHSMNRDIVGLLQGSKRPLPRKVREKNKSEKGFPGPLGPRAEKTRKRVENNYFSSFFNFFCFFGFLVHFSHARIFSEFSRERPF